MKVILLGSTGYIGKEVLGRCLRTPAISSLVALSRRDLPEAAANPKLTVVMMEDFRSYNDSVLEQLRGADACVWSIGTYNGDAAVELEYPKAFQEALLKVLDAKQTFRYVYLGGAFTETDQEKALWFFSEGRRVRGLAQAELLEFGAQNPNIMTYVVRPGGVLAGEASALLLGYLLPMVSVRTLAAVMVDLAVNGGTDQVMENAAILEEGKKLLMNQTQ